MCVCVVTLVVKKKSQGLQSSSAATAASRPLSLSFSACTRSIERFEWTTARRASSRKSLTCASRREIFQMEGRNKSFFFLEFSSTFPLCSMIRTKRARENWGERKFFLGVARESFEWCRSVNGECCTWPWIWMDSMVIERVLVFVRWIGMFEYKRWAMLFIMDMTRVLSSSGPLCQTLADD